MQQPVHVYVDGSFRQGSAPTWAYSVITSPETSITEGDIVDPNSAELIYQDAGVVKDVAEHKHWNIAGELRAVIEALCFCNSEKYHNVILHYDYEGIEKWANDSWKANNPLTKYYQYFVQHIPLNIKFKKEKAHTNNVLHDAVDKLAYGELT